MSPAAAPTLGIIAGTSLGQALAARLAEDGRPVQVWLPAAGSQPATGALPATATSLAELTGRCELLVVDSQLADLPELARAIGSVTDGGHRLAHTVRGFLPDGRSASELLRRETAVRRIGVIAGPLGAADLLAGRPTAAVVASRHPEVVEELSAALSTPRLRVYRGRDPLGVELCQSLVDLVGYSSGLTTGLGFGEATRALLIVRSVRELGRLIAALGGDAATATGLAGLGAILVRSSSPDSEAYQLGVSAASGRPDPASAGASAILQTASTLTDLARRQKVAVHLLDGLAQLLQGKLTPADLVSALMTIPVLDD